MTLQDGTLEILLENFKRDTGRTVITERSDAYKLLENDAMAHAMLAVLITQVENLAVLIKDVQEENVHLRKRLTNLECDVDEIEATL